MDVLEAVELKSSLCYNTDREMMKMAQNKAHIEITDRFEKKAYDKILLRIRKDADIDSDSIRIYTEARGESINEFYCGQLQKL